MTLRLNWALFCLEEGYANNKTIIDEQVKKSLINFDRFMNSFETAKNYFKDPVKILKNTPLEQASTTKLQDTINNILNKIPYS